MSSVNTGNQLIYWRYKQELISSDLGKMLHNIIQPGVYSGGNITLDSGDTVNIAPLDVVCYTSANQWVHVKTQDTASLELSETDCYVTCQFTWVDSPSNYMDFTAKASGDILTTDVIIGKALYEVGAITGFDYSEKTYGILRGESEFKIGSNYHNRKDFNKVKSDSARTTLVIPDYIETIIDGDVYNNLVSYEIDIDTTTYWDDTSVTDWTTPANRAGKDFYIYACVPASGETFDIVLSANSTYPTGYTASNSRKIGGFHCLCVSAGTAVYGYVNEGKDADYLENMFADGSTIANGDTNHWLKNFIQGDILPLSCWDLIHRPNENADVEGKVFDPKTNLWVDIYLPSWNSGLNKLLSVYGGTIADGGSSPAFHWYRFSQAFTNQGQRLPRQDHFVACSLGSPQGVTITGIADPITTGGHTATNSLRIISNIGVEDATGVLAQWGSESGNITTTNHTNAYDVNDKNVGGQEYSNITRPIFGGAWNDGGVVCGSRSSMWINVGLNLYSSISGRGFAEPK